MILLIDSYDSFTYSLAQYLGTSPDTQVLRNDDAALEAAAQATDALVLSPGPGWPVGAGKLEEMICLFAGKKPILGVCPGHQAVAEASGRKFGLAKSVVHGKQSDIELLAEPPVFSNLANELPATCYHLIVVTEVLEEFEVVVKTTDDQETMTI